MILHDKELIIKIVNNRYSAKHDGWYNELIGTKLSVMVRDILDGTYTVCHEGVFRTISIDDAEEVV
jgi:hypothetical protein